MGTPQLYIYTIRLHASGCSSTPAGQGGSVTDLAFPDRYLMLGLTKHGPRRDGCWDAVRITIVCVCDVCAIARKWVSPRTHVGYHPTCNVVTPVGSLIYMSH